MDYELVKVEFEQVAIGEIFDRRTKHSKTFYKGDNKYALISCQAPLHYEDEEGKLQDIDLTIVDGKITDNIYKVDLLTDKIGYSVVSRKDGGRIDVKLEKFGGTNITWSEPALSGNKAIWTDVATDTDFIIEFRPQRVRCWKRLKSDKASKDATFKVIEDVAETELRVTDRVIGYDGRGRLTKSDWVSGAPSFYKTVETQKDVKEYEVVETFKGEVIERHPITRVKSTKTDVEYPVMIDADVEVGIAVTADDGVDRYFKQTGTLVTTKTTITLSTTPSVNAVANWVFSAPPFAWNKAVYEGYTRFDGITIPAGASIDDATLKLYYHTQGAGFAPRHYIYAFDEQDPNAPTAPGDLRNKTAGLASNVISTDLAANYAKTIPTNNDFDLVDIDVEPIVSELVASYGDYNNEAMLFFSRGRTADGTGWASIYAYDRGSTKDPTLVINYTGGAPSLSAGPTLYYRKGGATYGCVSYTTSGSGWDDTMQVRHGGKTYFLKLESTLADPDATDLRVRKGGTTFAVCASATE